MGNQDKHASKYSVCMRIQCEITSVKFKFSSIYELKIYDTRKILSINFNLKLTILGRFYSPNLTISPRKNLQPNVWNNLSLNKQVHLYTAKLFPSGIA